MMYSTCNNYNPSTTERNGQHSIEEQAKSGVICPKDELSWYQKLHWVFFQVATLLQVLIAVLYWSLLAENDNVLNKPINYHVHLIGGIMSLVDVGISGIIISIYHVYTVMIYGSIYGVFSGVYYLAGGKAINGSNYIYPVLDYSTKPGEAVGLLILTILVIVPAFHLLMYFGSLLRRWAVWHLRKSCCKKETNVDVETNQENVTN